MPSPNTSVEELHAGVTRTSGQSHDLVLKRIGAALLEGQIGFTHDSAVFLPIAPVDQPAGASLMSPLAALRRVFDCAAEKAGKKLLVVGHADTSGDTHYNRALSELRARSVWAVLAGDREAWASVSEQHSRPGDLQLLLRFSSREHGFACDPGRIDGHIGPQTMRALARFRRRYNDELAGHLELHGPCTHKDWLAFFDMIEISLARVLEVPEGGLGPKRKALAFADEPCLGCGEHFPVASVGVDGLRSAGNRRVDFVFLDEAGYPSLQTQEPPGYELFGSRMRFRLEVIDPQVRFLDVRCVSTDGHPIPEIEFSITFADGSEREGTLDRTGGRLLSDVPPGPFTIRYPEVDDVRAKALAARLRAALADPRDWPAIYAVLAQSPKTLEAVDGAYASYFDTLGRKGMKSDVYDAARGTSHEIPCDHLFANAGVSTLAPESNTVAIAWVAPSFLEEDGGSGGGSGGPVIV